MGQKGMPTGSIILSSCKVPVSARIGAEGEGFNIAMNVLNRSRITVASQAIGVAIAAFEAALDYSQKRSTFGKPLILHQAIAFKIADMVIGLKTAKLIAWKAAKNFDEGNNFILDASVAKVYATEVARKVVNEALQIYGGIGYTKKYPVERYYRDQRVMELYAGASEIQRIIISRQLIKEFKS